MRDLVELWAPVQQELTIHDFMDGTGMKDMCTVEKVLNKLVHVPLYKGRSKCMLECGMTVILI